MRKRVMKGGEWKEKNSENSRGEVSRLCRVGKMEKKIERERERERKRERESKR
jgi:hypothetical protein